MTKKPDLPSTRLSRRVLTKAEAIAITAEQKKQNSVRANRAAATRRRNAVALSKLIEEKSRR